MDPDQTAWMRRLVWIHAGRKHTMLVLSWRGLYTLIAHMGKTDGGSIDCLIKLFGLIPSGAISLA
jgi:hypothetical protein